MRNVLVSLILILSGCASKTGEGFDFNTHAVKMNEINGVSNWVITCRSNGVSYCYKRASAICPDGFEEVSKSKPSVVAANNMFVTAISDVTIKIQC